MRSQGFRAPCRKRHPCFLCAAALLLPGPLMLAGNLTLNTPVVLGGNNTHRAAVSPKSVWDIDALSAITPTVESTPLYAVNDLESLFYYALPWHGNATKVYAYIGVPAGTAPAGGWPAILLAHGGGGTAYHAWVKSWRDRGFVALSMDLEGRLPDPSSTVSKPG